MGQGLGHARGGKTRREGLSRGLCQVREGRQKQPNKEVSRRTPAIIVHHRATTTGGYGRTWPAGWGRGPAGSSQKGSLSIPPGKAEVTKRNSSGKEGLEWNVPSGENSKYKCPGVRSLPCLKSTKVPG